MKAGAEHVVPLSDAVLAVLENLKPAQLDPVAKVFAVHGAARSNMAMAMLLRRMGYVITTHGFRSTFRDWAGDCTDHPREVIEAALAHTIQNKAEKAYRRGTAVERRRALMQHWAEYLTGHAALT
jgi:integrase